MKTYNTFFIQKLTQQVVNTQEEDMFAIPSSQVPVEPRYSSQRSIMARTQSILSNQRQPKNYFENVLIKCGVGLETMECYVLSKCQSPFIYIYVKSTFRMFQHAIT